MSQAWDKEKIWVFHRNWTYDLPHTGQMLHNSLFIKQIKSKWTFAVLNFNIP